MGTRILMPLTWRTRCIRNAPALMHGLYSIRFSQLAHQTSDFLVIRSITYKQTLIKTGRKGRFINQVPLSSCFYEYLFRDFCDGRKEKCSDWMRQQKKGELREPCIKAGAFRKASIQIFEVKRAGMAMQFPFFLRQLFYLIFFTQNITRFLLQTRTFTYYNNVHKSHSA